MNRQNRGLISFFILFIGLMAIPSLAQESAVAFVPFQGQVLEGLRFSSAVLGREVRYDVYLPPDYQLSTRRYPVVYLLHGFTDDESAWIQFGEVNLAADRAIAQREIPPLIIVMPDGGVTWYINDLQGKVRYEDMFIQEFIPYIDQTYRTRPAKEFRGIAGLSMGGWGALMFSMRHPGDFAACAAFSAAVWPDEEIISIQQPMYDRFFSEIFGAKPAGKNRLNPHFRQYNPLDLAKTLPLETLKKVRFYIDCGDDDFLIQGNAALHVTLKARKIPDEFRVRAGGHSWVYWRTGVVEGLKFIGRSFQR
ncbi:MAG TPA: alpha/beta hydrolase family protein [Candidatus Desulfaltia sp.]|nr:alpha/beta hydrolase family protein [Candidatus Desulfaltia sp.]